MDLPICRYIVLNERNQFIEEFDNYEDALEYLHNNEPPKEFWQIYREA